jgi:ketosteroid isomerase-like protein
MKNIFISVVFLVLYFGCVAAAFCQVRSPQTRTDFDAFLKIADAAQVGLQKGDAAAYKSLWSNSDEVTLSGGFGGAVEKGWTAVAKRLDWAATQFSNGTNTIERLVAVADGNIAYVVQLEHIKFKVPSTGLDATRDFRVTMVFRREDGAWKIVHRHADGQNAKQPA